MAVTQKLLEEATTSSAMAQHSDLFVPLAVFLGLLWIYWIYRQLRRNSKLPPGPWGLPIVGIIPFIKKEFHLFLFDNKKVYGDLFSLSMGQETIVVLANPKLIRLAFKSTDMAARPKTELAQLLKGYGKSTLMILYYKDTFYAVLR